MVLMHKTILISSIFLLTLLSLPLQSLASSISDFSPVSHWTCDEEGGVRYDSVTATGNDLTDNNTVGFDTGLLGNACDFTLANSEYLSITDATQSGLDVTDALSISFWAKLKSMPGGAEWSFASKNQTAQLAFNLEFGVQPNGVYLIVSQSGNTSSGYDEYDSASSILPSDSAWHYYVMTINMTTGTAVFYIDSTPYSMTRRTSQQASSFYNSSGNFQIGSHASTRYPDAYIDEYSFFDTVLTLSDITTLYNSGTPLDYSGGTPPVDPPATTTPTTTPTTSDNGDLVFMLSVIVFFLSTFWVGYIMSMFRKTS